MTLAASQSSEAIYSELGTYHMIGAGGLEQSNERAIYWFTKAGKASTPDPRAQYLLATLLMTRMRESFGGEVTGFSALPKATYWLRKAAESGYQDAINYLGEWEETAKSRPCASCDGPLPKVRAKRCSKCKIVYYCSKECQAKHWRTKDWRKGHHVECLDKSMT